VLPHLPNPSPAINLLDHEIPRIWVMGRYRLIPQYAAIEALTGYYSTPALRVPRVRRRNVIIAELLPPSPVTRSDGTTECFVDLQKAIVIIPRVVETKSCVGMESIGIAFDPIGVVGSFRTRVGIECFGATLATVIGPI
jgi:hypothetical protein